MNAEQFNALYEVGVPVFAYPGCRPEDFPSDRRLVTRTRSKAEVLGGHTDVVWVDDYSSCIALSHVDVVPEDEWKEAKLAATVATEGALPMPGGPGPLDDERLAEIEARVMERTAAFTEWLNRHSPMPGQETANRAEAVLEEDVPVLLAEIRRLRRAESGLQQALRGRDEQLDRLHNEMTGGPR